MCVCVCVCPAAVATARLLGVPAGGKIRQLRRRVAAAVARLDDPEFAELMGAMADGIAGAAA